MNRLPRSHEVNVKCDKMREKSNICSHACEYTCCWSQTLPSIFVAQQLKHTHTHIDMPQRPRIPVYSSLSQSSWSETPFPVAFNSIETIARAIASKREPRVSLRALNQHYYRRRCCSQPSTLSKPEHRIHLSDSRNSDLVNERSVSTILLHLTRICYSVQYQPAAAETAAIFFCADKFLV